MGRRGKHREESQTPDGLLSATTPTSRSEWFKRYSAPAPEDEPARFAGLHERALSFPKLPAGDVKE
jgi:hypothetical protein